MTGVGPSADAAVPHCVHVAAATLARPSTGTSAADPECLEEAPHMKKGVAQSAHNAI